MKSKRNILCAFSLMMSLGMAAQTQFDAERLIGTELNGTARFVGMGGAMGALGGDLSVMGTNPAGIGIYRSNDFAVSFGANNSSNEATFNSTMLKDDKTRFSFDQVGFVYSNKIGNNTSLRYVNFGFNYKKNKNFNRQFVAGGNPQGLSQTWQMVNTLQNCFDTYGMNSDTWANEVDAIYNSKNPYMDNTQYPYLGVMGVRTDLVGVSSKTNLPIGWNSDLNKFTSREEGGISEYDFNVSFNIEDRYYLGITLGAYDVNYKKFSYYTEDISDDNDNQGYYELTNWFKTKGSGVDLKLGFIARPFEDSPFRVGLAIHTPTWYNLSDYHYADITSNIAYMNNGVLGNPEGVEEYSPDYTNNGDIRIDYQLVTPWKFNFSMGTTVSNILAIGAEYEYSDYSAAKLKYDDGADMEIANYAISEDLKGVSTLRLGLEAKIVPEFSLRAGYNLSTAAFSDKAYKTLNWNDTRTDTDFNNTKDKNTFTFGLGYRGNTFYADLAYKYDYYKSDFYAFDNVDLPATKVTNSRNQLLLTLGAKF